MISKTIALAATAVAISCMLGVTHAQTKGSYTTYGTGCKGSGLLPGGKIVPTAYATKWGESNNVFPFGWSNQHYMQVHDAKDIGPAPVQVRGLAFRTLRGRSLRARVIPCTIRVGYTNNPTSGLSTTFASNWVGTPSVGFTGNLNVAATSANNSLTQFDTVIPLKVPFIYLPARGNFLWECENAATQSITNIYDFINNASAPIGRMWATGSTAPTGTFRANQGITTQLVGATTTGAIVQLSNTGVPQINSSFQVTFSGAVTNSAAVLWLGAQKLNISLSPTLPGCTLYSSLDILLASAPTGIQGSGAVPLTFPNDRTLVGLQFRNQWMVLDPQANGLGVVLSNGGDALIGG